MAFNLEYEFKSNTQKKIKRKNGKERTEKKNKFILKNTKKDKTKEKKKEKEKKNKTKSENMKKRHKEIM